jgi:uncharacterized protein YjbI with pentapeptide repeats
MSESGVDVMIEPAQAFVYPRIVCPETGDAVRLDEYVDLWFAERHTGTLEIVGGPGSGKSTAIAHLTKSLSSDVLLLDDAPREAVEATRGLRPVIYTTAASYGKVADERLPLAAWGNDELVEYLMAAHPDRCGCVMKRVAALPDRALLRGVPALWVIVLEQLAAADRNADVRAMLAQALAELVHGEQQRIAAQSWACAYLVANGSDKLARELALADIDRPLARLLQHRIVQLYFATAFLRDLIDASECKWLPRLPSDLVSETGTALRSAESTMAKLRSLVEGNSNGVQPMAASILFAADSSWRPTAPMPRLAGGYFSGASWQGIDLSGEDLGEAHFDEAVLAGSLLANTNLTKASFRGANLRGANLTGCRASVADFLLADLSHVAARGARFAGANLAAADLSNAALDAAMLRSADLSSANFAVATLVGADLGESTIEGADFSRADLSQAKLSELPLRLAECNGAVFSRAELMNCDLEGVRLESPVFAFANLNRALLTGSFMPKANFHGARLRGAGLADIDWEQADLRDADLREATFFLGSTRSGLVDSPIACEGSRTGFYTDDFEAQQFKAPEEIRKANLRGADLRGARIAGTDFYLVDLRDARYTPMQADYFRGCGAILEDRVVR